MFDLLFIYVGRNWKEDEPQMRFMAEKYLQLPNLLLLIFPEGTDYSPEKHSKSVKVCLPLSLCLSRSSDYSLALQFAKEQGLKPYSHVLTPRVKGFVLLARVLRPRLQAIYDFTVAYENSGEPV